ncbi:MAG: MFS transporter [Chloroflexia bacterium]
MRVIVGFLAFILIGSNDGVSGVLLPGIQAHYGVDKATVALLFLAGSGGYLVATLGSGALAGRLGLRGFVLLGGWGLSASMALLGVGPPFAVLLGGVLASGFSVGCLDAGLNTWTAGLPNNSALLNYLHASYGLGALIGPLVATAVLAAVGTWNVVYLVLAAWGILVLGGLAARLRPAEALPADAPARGALLETLRLRGVLLAGAFLLVYVGTEVSLGNWAYSLLTEARQVGLPLAGGMVSGYWAGLMLGRLALGRLAGRVGTRRLIAGCLAGVFAGIGLLWLGQGAPTLALGLLLTGFSLGPLYPTTIAVLAESTPARLLPGAVGFVSGAGSIGAAVFAWLAGQLAQQFGLLSLPPYALCLTAVMLILWLRQGSQPVPPGRRPADL